MARGVQPSPYSECDQWLRPRVWWYHQWTSDDFDKVITRIRELPQPRTTALRDELKASALTATIRRLAHRIGASALQERRLLGGRRDSPASRLLRLWQVWVPYTSGMDHWGWGAFAKAAGDTVQPSLLCELLGAWNPRPGTLERLEHVAWGEFLNAAFNLGKEKIVLEIFRRLESCFDRARLPHRGSLRAVLLSIAAGLQDEEVAAEITEALHDSRLDTTYCLDVLAQEQPQGSFSVKAGRFEGAARRLMRWLVNSYFHCEAEEFGRRLTLLVGGVSNLKRFRMKAWHAMLCRGQEVYAGCIVSRCVSRLASVLGYIDNLDDEQLLVEIQNPQGGLVDRIIQVQEKELGDISLPQPASAIATDAPARRLEPLVGHLCNNQRDYLAERKLGNRPRFLRRAWELLLQGKAESFTEEDWSDFLRMLLRRMAEAVWESMLDQVRGEVHHLKREFVAVFQRPLREGSLSARDRVELARSARKFLRDYRNPVAGYALGEPMPISVASAVKYYIVGGRRQAPTTAVDLDDGIHIAAWEGAKNTVLRPMFIEIRNGVEAALRDLLPDQRLYRVSLKEGQGDDSGYAVLTVTNACRVHPSSSPYSTGLGSEIVRRLARLFRHERLRGFARRDCDKMDGQLVHVWRIALPLWKGEAREVPEDE